MVKVESEILVMLKTNSKFEADTDPEKEFVWKTSSLDARFEDKLGLNFIVCAATLLIKNAVQTKAKDFARVNWSVFIELGLIVW